LLDYPVRWVLASLGVRVELGQWADLRHTTPRPTTLTERARVALKLYPAQLLLVHRDAERLSGKDRLHEVRRALQAVTDRYVAIIPVRMTEAWLLHDPAAIRRASGNPNGTTPLALPEPADVERVADPKGVLLDALLAASDLAGARRQRRRKDFPAMRTRTAELISDFGPLTNVPSFQAVVAALESALIDLGHLSRPVINAYD